MDLFDNDTNIDDTEDLSKDSDDGIREDEDEVLHSVKRCGTGKE